MSNPSVVSAAILDDYQSVHPPDFEAQRNLQQPIFWSAS
jgi:hypothetical protein